MISKYEMVKDELEMAVSKERKSCITCKHEKEDLHGEICSVCKMVYPAPTGWIRKG